MRKPKEYRPFRPGDLVEVDTLAVRPLPGVIWKHYTGRDVISRWDVIQAHTRATAGTATQFLDSLHDPRGVDQSLGYLTPLQFLQQWHARRKG